MEKFQCNYLHLLCSSNVKIILCFLLLINFLINLLEMEFRNYTDTLFKNPLGSMNTKETVKRHYELMRSHQTKEHVKKMEDKYFKFDHAELTIEEAFEKLERYVDNSDPDMDLPNLEHMLQTAEAMRKDNLPDWFILVGLIHDLGKIMFLWGTKEDGQEGTATGEQWSLGGDTWIIGCKIPETIVYHTFNQLHPDYKSTELGIYEKGCGLENVKFAFGHDEYLYRMLEHNTKLGKCFLPREAGLIIRYHSCYVWHTHNEYTDLMNKEDEAIKELVKLFNKYDLYTKNATKVNKIEVLPYYQNLIKKYLPEKLKF
jgi:inositol oxygenase